MKTTPQIEAILASLTELCCAAMKSDDGWDQSRVDQLVASLSTNGWRRHSQDESPLSTVLKDRIKDQCKEPAMHRGAAIDGLVAKVQKSYDDASRMVASSPADNQPQAMPPRATT